MKITEHLLTLEELCDKLETEKEKGITETEAELRFKRDGPMISLHQNKLRVGFYFLVKRRQVSLLLCGWHQSLVL